MSSAICVNLGQSKILSSGNYGLIKCKVLGWLKFNAFAKKHYEINSCLKHKICLS